MDKGVSRTGSTSYPIDRLGPMEAESAPEEPEHYASAVSSRQALTDRFYWRLTHEHCHTYSAFRARHWRPEVCLETPDRDFIRLHCYYQRRSILPLRKVLCQRTNISYPVAHTIRRRHLVWHTVATEPLADRGKW